MVRHWHANGILALEMDQVNGLAEGAVREWHDNGQLAVEKTYVNGKVDGIVRHWNPDGKLLGEYEMKMGRGIQRTWYEDGRPFTEMEFLAENAVKGRVWDDLGKAREVYLWNGKPVSKKKFHEKLARQQADF
jgi:antitoxin component YwqK of YwqJK toxin-antitoxin module